MSTTERRFWTSLRLNCIALFIGIFLVQFVMAQQEILYHAKVTTYKAKQHRTWAGEDTWMCFQQMRIKDHFDHDRRITAEKCEPIGVEQDITTGVSVYDVFWHSIEATPYRHALIATWLILTLLIVYTSVTLHYTEE